MSAPAPVVVLGDGTTFRSRARTRGEKLRWPLTVLALALLVGLAAAVLRPETSTTPLAPDNPGDDGGRALAQVLGRAGVEVGYARTTAQAVQGVRDGGTLLVATTFLLTDDQVEEVARAGADHLVLVEPQAEHLEVLTDGAVVATGYQTTEVRAPRCSDPDATAAGSALLGTSGLEAAADDVVVCFGTAGSTAGAMAVVERERRVTVLDDSAVLRNDTVTEAGNAALAIRVLGKHPDLVWFVPSAYDTGGLGGDAPSTGDMLPGWTGPAAALGLLVVVVTALWRARSLGPVVTEPLPVTVRAAEATAGRGRLYRRVRARGHAAASLRAGTARRVAARLGLPRTAAGPEVVDAVARASGRPAIEVAELLYGPPPPDDDGLLLLARRLDELESEVHRT